MLRDVREGYVTPERARSVYAVSIQGEPERFETLAVDLDATARLRGR